MTAAMEAVVRPARKSHSVPRSVDTPALSFLEDVLPRLVPMADWDVIGSRVYFLECDSRFVKIGWSQDFQERLIALQSANALRLRPAAILIADRSMEKSLHSHFQELHVRGEWFALHGTLKEFLSHPTVEAARGLSPEIIAMEPQSQPDLLDSKITITATGPRIFLDLDSETEGMRAFLDLEAAELHVATMQRAIAAVRAASPKVGPLTTSEPRP